MRVWLLLTVCLAACYSPSPPTGAPCDKDHPCPRPLVCAQATSTCERTDIDASVVVDPDAPMPDATDAPVGVPPPNDKPSEAEEATDGADHEVELAYAKDDAPQNGCGGAGGADVFFRVTLTKPEVYYVDTFGSAANTVVRVFPGRACTDINAVMSPACSDDACGGDESQIAAELPAGTSCIVVEAASNSTGTTAHVVIKPGRHFGDPLQAGVHTLTGDTCQSSDEWKPPCGEAGPPEDAYFFTVCPGATAHVDASTCDDVTQTHFDTVVYVRKAGTPMQGSTLQCSDDADGCPARPERPDHPDGSVIDNAQPMGPGLFFLLVDGYDANDCGVYSLVTDLH